MNKLAVCFVIFVVCTVSVPAQPAIRLSPDCNVSRDDLTAMLKFLHKTEAIVDGVSTGIAATAICVDINATANRLLIDAGYVGACATKQAAMTVECLLEAPRPVLVACLAQLATTLNTFKNGSGDRMRDSACNSWDMLLFIIGGTALRNLALNGIKKLVLKQCPNEDQRVQRVQWRVMANMGLHLVQQMLLFLYLKWQGQADRYNEAFPMAAHLMVGFSLDDVLQHIIAELLAATMVGALDAPESDQETDEETGVDDTAIST